jgi:hypothetical protein
MHFRSNRAAKDNRMFKLSDLEIFRSVRIKIRFPVEAADKGDIGLDSASELDGFMHGLLLTVGRAPGCPVQTTPISVLGSLPK